VKNLLGYVLIGVIKLLSRVSLARAQATGQWLGRRMMKKRTRAREVARVNIGLCYPELSAAEQNSLVEQSLLHSGMTGAEMGPMWGYSHERLMGMIRSVHNGELFDDAIAANEGVLLMVPHLGNWEIISTYAASRARVTAMYRPAKMKSFNDWMVGRREAVGANMVPTTKGGVEALFQILREGGVAGFLPDQEPKPERGVFAPFMDVETLTPNLPHQMIQESGCRVVFAFAERLENAAGFDIHFLDAEPDQYSADPVVAATAMNTTIARGVAQCPAQYQWTYKRFKRRPDGGMNPYKEAGVP